MAKLFVPHPQGRPSSRTGGPPEFTRWSYGKDTCINSTTSWLSAGGRLSKTSVF